MCRLYLDFFLIDGYIESEINYYILLVKIDLKKINERTVNEYIRAPLSTSVYFILILKANSEIKSVDYYLIQKLGDDFTSIWILAYALLKRVLAYEKKEKNHVLYVWVGAFNSLGSLVNCVVWHSWSLIS